jgi:hypothetical protein
VGAGGGGGRVRARRRVRARADAGVRNPIVIDQNYVLPQPRSMDAPIIRFRMHGSLRRHLRASIYAVLTGSVTCDSMAAFGGEDQRREVRGHPGVVGVAGGGEVRLQRQQPVQRHRPAGHQASSPWTAASRRRRPASTPTAGLPATSSLPAACNALHLIV